MVSDCLHLAFDFVDSADFIQVKVEFGLHEIELLLIVYSLQLKGLNLLEQSLGFLVLELKCLLASLPLL